MKKRDPILVAGILLAGYTVVQAAALAQRIEPVAPVPRFGPGSPAYQASAQGVQLPPRDHRRVGRAGPPGTVMPSGQVGPACMTPLWKAGFRTNHVDCPLYPPTSPGASQQCMARDMAGRTRRLTVTFLDWDAATGRGAIDCRLNRPVR